jgi:hypothetical protein
MQATTHRSASDLFFHSESPSSNEGFGQSLLLRVLDEVDYGLIVIDAQGHIRHANHLARHEMSTGRLIMAQTQSLLGRMWPWSMPCEVSGDWCCSSRASKSFRWRSFP